ncbi:hypothetical protein HRbin12_00625 [bacterium HR12]|nr:hypothetical protein HRbin12_00625 [bacterium HR12]
MRIERRLREIEAAFAEAVAAGDLRAAEGWVAVASFVAAVEPPEPRGPVTNRLDGSR